jgi:hypothetical protein
LHLPPHHRSSLRLVLGSGGLRLAAWTLAAALLFLVGAPAAAESVGALLTPPATETSDLRAGAAPGDGPEAPPLFMPPSDFDFTGRERLLSRIRATPHGYFRFINVAFSQEVCRRFETKLPHAPRVNLHGDAHLEQYAVTDMGRGLTDFDDSSIGPFVLDLMRLGVSLRLASRSRGWLDRSDELFRELLRGYRAALADPELEAPEPSLVTTIRRSFKSSRADYFSWIETIMDPIPPEEQAQLESAMAPYIEAMLAQDPEQGPDYFDIVQAGYLRLGIGSAMDKKYLLRIRGETDQPDDDVMLELKEVRDLSSIECIAASTRLDPFRILLGQARISYRPFRLLGYVRVGETSFWVHAWVDNYRELGVESFETPEQLAEVVFDVGVQLGRGQPKKIADPFGWQFRRELGQALDLVEPRLIQEIHALEEATVEAWKRFSAEAPASD